MKDKEQRKGKGSLNWKSSISVGMIIVLLTSIFYGINGTVMMNQPRTALAEVTIEALQSDSMGIEPDTAFLLTSLEPIDEKTIQASLVTEPEFQYNMEKLAGGLEYKIIPQSHLAGNTIYRLAFNQDGLGKENLSWAFQTKSEFRVIRSLPNNQSTHVPVDTGIEITFSHNSIDIDNAQKHFHITPSVEGNFEIHQKTLVFAPFSLQPSTIYTVTLDEGFSLLQSTDTLGEDYSFSFETAPAEQGQMSFDFNMDTDLTEFSTLDKPAFSVYFAYAYSNGKGNTDPPPLHIDLYRYPDHQTFQASLGKRDLIPRWSYYGWNRYREELNSQYHYAEYDTDFLRMNQYSHYIVLPKELEAGFYAAEFQAGDAVRQVWFQVSDLAVYLAQSEESSLFWAHDLTTKSPAPGLNVSIASQNINVNGDQPGAVLISKKLLGAKPDYALVKSGSKETLVPLEAKSRYAKESPNASDYWKYLYLDRELYRPGDTVNYWGVVAPRLNTDGPVQDVTLELQGTDGPYYPGTEATPILSQTIPVTDKTYNGQFKLPTLKPGYYYFDVKIGDIELQTRGFSVETYHKPSYQLTISQDKTAVFKGENQNFRIKASFFEGTPVPNIKLNYHVQGRSGSVTTNETGEAVIPYQGEIQDEYYNPYSYVSLDVNAELPEIGEIHSSAELYVFKSKVFLTGEANRDGHSYTLSGKLSEIDLTDINHGQYMAEENFVKEPVPNDKVKASLYQEVWTKQEAGQQYDFIEKKVIKTYHYQYSTIHVEDFDLLTGSDGAFTYTGTLDPDNSYYLDLTAEDQDGRRVVRRVYVGGDRSNSPDYLYYFLQGDPEKKDGYRPGDRVTLTFMVNDKQLVPSGNNLLFFRGQKNIETYSVLDNPHYEFNFTDGDIPNVHAYGVYFDGYGYHETYSAMVPFARDTRALNVTVKTNQPEYRPGENAKLEIQVTDVQGNPVQNAEVNINLVDEAVFSLRDQNVNLLNSLYGDYMNLYLVTRKSHDHPEFGGGAESGGEGEGIRKDFQDTVVFKTIRTNSEGEAQLEFQLPDDLTSWRVTYHALTKDLEAGSGTSHIPVRLPFFAEMNLNSVYLEGDSPLIVLRSYGEKLVKNQKVAYQMKLTSQGGAEQTWSESSTSFTPVDWKIPALQAGNYTLTVSAKCGNLEDSLSKGFKVEKTFQQRTVTVQSLLQEGMDIQGSEEELTTVIFSDYEKSQYLRGLYQMAWSYGSRLEQKLASYEARKLLQYYFPHEENVWGAVEEEKDSLLQYQQPNGGISILPYGTSELALSAIAASGSSDIFDQHALRNYFYYVLEGKDPEDDDSLALLGLAALKEPVLLEVRKSVQESNLAPGVKINLALALLELGDGAYAQDVYRELMAQYGEDLGSVIRINIGQSQDEMIGATTQMAMLAARLDQPEKYKLYQFLLENPGKEILNSVEQILILKYHLQYMKAAPVSFTMEKEGEKITQTLKDREIYKLILLPEERKTMKITQVEGKVGMLTQYNIPVQAEEKKTGELKINRVYRVKQQATNKFDRTDLVEVVINCTFTDTAPTGLYEVVDVLPAGLTHIARPYNYQENRKLNWSYPAEVNGQRLVFHVGKGSGQIRYLARVISPGEFVCEPPILNNIKNSAVYTSGRADRIVIQ